MASLTLRTVTGFRLEARPFGTLTTTSAGTFGLEWAQAVADAFDATLYAVVAVSDRDRPTSEDDSAQPKIRAKSLCCRDFASANSRR